MILDLGCGAVFEPMPGTVGLDLRPPASVLGDLAAPALPFADDVFDEVRAEQVLEHVRAEHQYRLWNEVARVLVPGGLFTGSVPGLDLSLALAVRDPTHVSWFVQETFRYLIAGPEHEAETHARAAGREAEWEIESFVSADGWAYVWRVRAVK